MHEWNERFASAIREFNALAKSGDATLDYCMLSDALCWSDELPPGSASDTLYLFRCLVNYRTKLIIGEPNAAGLPFWLWAKGAFPNWPGFDGDRCRPDETLAGFYRRSEATAMFSFDLEEVFCALEEQFNEMVPRRVIKKRAERTTPPDITAGEIYELVYRCQSLARKEIPADAWQRVRDSVSEALNVSPELVTKASQLGCDLGAGR
jgi:hypothetical protein